MGPVSPHPSIIFVDAGPSGFDGGGIVPMLLVIARSIQFWVRARSFVNHAVTSVIAPGHHLLSRPCLTGGNRLSWYTPSCSLSWARRFFINSTRTIHSARPLYSMTMPRPSPPKRDRTFGGGRPRRGSLPEAMRKSRYATHFPLIYCRKFKLS